MSIRSKYLTGLIAVIAATSACKARNTSDLSGVELAEKDDSTGRSVYIYTPDKKLVYYRVCPNTWKPRDRIDIGESTIDIDLVFDASKLQDPKTAQDELKKLDALIEAYKASAAGQGVLVTGEKIKAPFTTAECTDDDLYKTPIAYDKYVAAVGNTLGVVKPETVALMRDKLIDKQFAVKGLVAEIVKAKDQMERGNKDITPEIYAAAVKSLADKMKEAQDLHADIRDLEIKRRTFNDIISNLPEERSTGIVNNLTNGKAYKAMMDPFVDVANVNKELYTRVKRDMIFRYAGKMSYVQGLEKCSSQGMVMAGRVEFYYLNRFINGRENIAGYGDADSSQNQSQTQNPTDPTVTPLSGQFWVGTFSYDLSRALALQAYRVKMRSDKNNTVNPYNPTELSAFANASNMYLPANFEFASEVGLQGLDQRQGFNYSWAYDFGTSQYIAGELYGQEKQVLCVSNKNFDYTDDVIKLVKKEIAEGVQEFKTTTYNWDRHSTGPGNAAYLYRSAAYRYEYAKPEWANIQASNVWICSAKMTGYSNGAAVKYNFHNLVLSPQTNPETTRNYVIANCHASNRSVIRGQGTCNINVCTDCKNLLDQSTFPCSKQEKDNAQEQQQSQKPNDQNQSEQKQQIQDFEEQF